MFQCPRILEPMPSYQKMLLHPSINIDVQNNRSWTEYAQDGIKKEHIQRQFMPAFLPNQVGVHSSLEYMFPIQYVFDPISMSTVHSQIKKKATSLPMTIPTLGPGIKISSERNSFPIW